MPKAERDGVYVLNGRHFKTRKGAILPDGAEMIGAVEVEAVPEQKAQQAAPENKARASAPAKKSE